MINANRFERLNNYIEANLSNRSEHQRKKEKSPNHRKSPIKSLKGNAIIDPHELDFTQKKRTEFTKDSNIHQTLNELMQLQMTTSQ
jgi:hypothetical protein